MCKMKNTLTQVAIVIAVTFVVSVLFSKISNEQFQNIVVIFYAPGIFLSFLFQGGPHNAPQGVLYIGIFLQNIILWLIIRSTYKYYVKAKNT